MNDIVNAISKALYTTFGSDYRYYVEDVEQNLKTPCFTIELLEPRMRSRNAQLYDRTVPVVVHYITNNKTSLKKEYYGIADQILECLEYLNVNNKIIRGESMSYHIVEDALQLFVTYKFMTIDENALVIDNAMDEITGNITHK